jgi:hypothetical protein
MAKRRACAYCGVSGVRLDREHVIPACLYPASRGSISRVQRMTVPACRTCNRSWADDEPHLRNVLLVAGEANAAVRELWSTIALRSFRQVDGERRRIDLANLFEPVSVNGEGRWMIYPDKDSRVLRVVRKVVRGLSHYHGIETAVADDRVWTEVMKYRIPEDLRREISFEHREADICRYWYQRYSEGDTQSAWLLTFFEARTFIASVAAAG